MRAKRVFMKTFLRSLEISTSTSMARASGTVTLAALAPNFSAHCRISEYIQQEYLMKRHGITYGSHPEGNVLAELGCNRGLHPSDKDSTGSRAGHSKVFSLPPIRKTQVRMVHWYEDLAGSVGRAAPQDSSGLLLCRGVFAWG